MLTADVHPDRAWPRVREVGPERWVVSGHATRLVVWLVLRVLAHCLIALLGLWILAAAFAPIFVGVYESLGPGHPLSAVIGGIIDLRWGMRRVLHDWIPWLGRALLYNPHSAIDWHLLVLFIVFYRLRPVTAYGLTLGLSKLLRPLLGRRFKLSFTPDTVLIHRRIWTLRLHRNDLDGEGVTFRVTERSPQPGVMGWLCRIGWLKPSPDLDLPVVMAVCGRRMIPIATPPHSREAQRIVESCLIALNQSRT